MTNKYDIVTAMDLCVDFLVWGGDIIPEFGQKEKIIGDYLLELGGSSSIFACQCAKLNLKTVGIGVLGEDFFGEIVLDKLRKAGVIVDYVRVEKGKKTGVGVAICKENDRAILTYPGTIDEVRAGDVLQVLNNVNARHLHIGSYYLTQRLQPHYKEIVKKAKEKGMTISLDTNWDPAEQWEGGVLDILPYIDIFFPNENELLGITKKNNIRAAVEFLQDKTKIIAVKKGRDGAEVYKGKEHYEMPGLNVEVADTVGAGDNFDAGFVFGFLHGYDLKTCLKAGIICGSSSTQKSGGIAGQISYEKLKEMI